MNKTVKIISLILAVFSLMLGANALAARVDSKSLDNVDSKLEEIKMIEMIDKTEISPIITEISPIINEIMPTFNKEVLGANVINAATSNNTQITTNQVSNIVAAAPIYPIANYWSANGSNIYNNNSGNVGIGTINPSTKLAVAGRISSGRLAQMDGQLTLYSSNENSDVFHLDNRGGGSLRISKGLQVGTVDLMTIIGQSGRVGIGIINPSEKLDVLGNVKIGNGEETAILKFNASSYGGLYFNGETRLAIDTSGNVGIGTTKPDSKLTVNGALNVNGKSWLQDTVSIGRPMQTNGKVTLIPGNEHMDYFHIDNRGNNSLRISRGYSTQTDIMTITSPQGNVGIGTTAPNYKLDVNGTLKANYYVAYNGQYGLTKTVKVKGNNNQNCDLNFTNGLLTATNCPTNGNNGNNSTD